jgi:hypothetical protein
MKETLMRQEAERFRRLAASIRDLDLRRRLLTMAERLELQAARSESAEEAAPRRRARTRTE